MLWVLIVAKSCLERPILEVNIDAKVAIALLTTASPEMTAHSRNYTSPTVGVLPVRLSSSKGDPPILDAKVRVRLPDVLKCLLPLLVSVLGCLTPTTLTTWILLVYGVSGVGV